LPGRDGCGRYVLWTQRVKGRAAGIEISVQENRRGEPYVKLRPRGQRPRRASC
jgi:hypothetical protein